MKLQTIIYLGLTAIIVTISALNASWIAPQPAGSLKLIAARGSDPDKDNCISTDGLQQAFIAGAEYVITPVTTKSGCASLDDAIRYIPNRKLIISVANPGEVDTMVERFAAFKRPFDDRYSLTGNGAAVAGAHAKLPDTWGWSETDGRTCYSAYLWQGWYGAVPEICRGKTMIVGLSEQWFIWGWPNRFQQRMKDAGVRVILTDLEGGKMKGITGLQQIPEIPRDFKGYALIDDIMLIGRAIKS